MPQPRIEVDKKVRHITLYRGLGLPKEAVETYKKYRDSGTKFAFTAFTSTSTEKSTAVEFAWMAELCGKDPALFVLKTRHN